MTDSTLKLEIKLNYATFLAITLLAHFLLILISQAPSFLPSHNLSLNKVTPLKIHTLGNKASKSTNSVFLKPQIASQASTKKALNKDLNLRDLSAASFPKVTKDIKPFRPGTFPKSSAALSGLRLGNDELKKLSKDSPVQGGADILSSQRIALNFEIPKGKNLDELNESELRLYGFLKRGAMKYVASLSSEIKDFELKNPHLTFPISDKKEVMTGRLTYDGQGNLKQIKMVRWTNVEKLQSFFENVMKRLDNLQNPPKELWVEDGEFTIFVTLQING